MYCCVNGVTETFLSREVEPAGTRSSHDLPSNASALLADSESSIDETPIIHQMHATQCATIIKPNICRTTRKYPMLDNSSSLCAKRKRRTQIGILQMATVSICMLPVDPSVAMAPIK